MKHTKKWIAAFLTAVLLCGVLPLTAGAASIDITAKFTDPNFLAEVYKATKKTAPEPIYDTDVSAVTELWMLQKGIQNLAGIEYFTSLQFLNCDANLLGAAGLPALPSTLTFLTCEANQLTSLPPLPPGLVYLWCSENQLSSLPELPSALESLDIGWNQFTSLPPLPPGLKFLFCSNNKLTDLDIAGLSLVELDVRSNSMSSQSAIKGSTGGIETLQFEPQNTHFWSAWPSWLQWVLQYILFGWLWMRWL